jgi:surface antigen
MPEPIRVFTDARGRTCRVYERRVLIDGTPSTALGTICREPSGRWVLSR